MTEPRAEGSAEGPQEPAQAASDPASVARALLAAARLPVHEAEVAALVLAYPAQRAALDTLYGIGPAPRTDPAVRAEPSHVGREDR
ncbi:hypothetical protein [Streptomyces uncialis]|uniref:hypothetical protein n=1 Tax=Streptomyces uncialis TaxID=1048205 RepID=UPI00224DE75E|nr:hypothetical protein [Streptomyces uncialis]MCX4658100.1 hypothetical protein [Streptomyces uncialis]